MKIAFLQFGAMCDVLYATPILRHVRKLYLNDKITWFIRDKFKEVVETNPHLDEIKTYSLPEGYQSRQDAEHVMWRQMKEDAARDFDLVIKPQQWPDHNFWRSNKDLISLMCENAGFNPDDIIDRSVEFNLTKEDKEQANIFISKNNLDESKFITCNHISYAASPVWTFDKYQKLTDQLAEKGIKCVFTGATNEPIPERAIDARGIPYRVWASIIDNSDYWVGLDSGAKTLAASTKTPMIVLHSKDFPLSKTGCQAMGIRTKNILELTTILSVNSIRDLISGTVR